MNINKQILQKKLKDYRKRAHKRWEKKSLKPRPLNKDEVTIFIKSLALPDLSEESFELFQEKRQLDALLIELIKEQVKRGNFPSSRAKAAGLRKIVARNLKSEYLSPREALDMLADMKGGSAAKELIELLSENIFRQRIIDILQDTVLVNRKQFESIAELSLEIPACLEIIKSWARRDFAKNWQLPDSYRGKTIKVGDNITTGHLSPSQRADTRTDHPRHAQFIMEGREDESDFLERLEKLKQNSDRIIFAAGEALGEGSSRKSATYTMLQILGQPVPGEPEKKAGGVVIAKSIAPIFKRSLIASGILPAIGDTGEIEEGDNLEIDIGQSKAIINNNKEIDLFLPDSYSLQTVAAGGMVYFDAANKLQKWAQEFCQEREIEVNEAPVPGQEVTQFKRTNLRPQTLAQKIVSRNRVDGNTTIKPGERAAVKVRGVFSQDTTGPMTIDEYQAMAGGDFGAEFVVQSHCHTAECPSTDERDRHIFLKNFVRERGGVSLEPGEGIIHTIGNRFVLPTDVIFGADSHTRTPRGISFPAASDIAAGAMKYGEQDIIMNESVKVEFLGEPRAHITARDLVSALVLYGEKDIYNGKIIEMTGLEFLDSNQRYIMTNATAERNASAGIISPDNKTLKRVEANLEYLKDRPDSESSPSVARTIEACQKFLHNPQLPEADTDAEYSAVIKIPLEEIKEPLIAQPHHPNNVVGISKAAGTPVDEVFIGSCMGGNYKSIKAAANLVKGKQISPEVNFVVSPAARDIYSRLANDGALADLTEAGANIILPGCGLCMGNKRRIASNSTAFTTTTRNYRARIGPPDSKTYLGSSRVAALTALEGEIPDTNRYFSAFNF